MLIPRRWPVVDRARSPVARVALCSNATRVPGAQERISLAHQVEDLMDDVSFDALSRRASLTALGTAGLAAAFTAPLTAGAKKKKKKKADVNKLCKKQVGQCTSFLLAQCAGQPTCPAIVACCSFFGKCNTTGFLACFDAAVAA